MTDLHIDDFYKDVARIFAQLYASFPRKIILYVEDICGPDSPDEFGLHCQRFLSCFSAMIWLAEAGYLNYETTIRQEALDQVSLTQRGLKLLYSRTSIDSLIDTSLAIDIQENVNAPPSNIALIRYVLKYGSSAALEKLMQSLLQTP